MSPRAAWQLEALGFKDVYDFVAGKAEWIAQGFPTEGNGPHYPLVGEVARRDIVRECHLGSVVADSRTAMGETGQSYCVVLNGNDILLGRLRNRHLTSGDEVVVEQVMEVGPSTVRATESADALLKRMEARDVSVALVTSAKGKFLGVARRKDLERLVNQSRAERYAGQERRH
ncbi:MAG: hypothetical protein H0W55_13995 [Actinobacteria bacterium]|nr:hypothetical protein [Actinomycetota bacterium]MDQ3533884.1 hypothetical protein [Actinomycetota bacterium]